MWQYLVRLISPGVTPGRTAAGAADARSLGRTPRERHHRLFTGSSGVPEASPGFSGDSGLSATAGAGTAAGAPAGPAAGETVTDKPARRGGSGLSGMLLADLQRLAQSMGITGIGRMRKSQLIEAIQSKPGWRRSRPRRAGWRIGWPLGGQREWDTRQLSPAWRVCGSRRVSPP